MRFSVFRNIKVIKASNHQFNRATSVKIRQDGLRFLYPISPRQQYDKLDKTFFQKSKQDIFKFPSYHSNIFNLFLLSGSGLLLFNNLSKTSDVEQENKVFESIKVGDLPRLKELLTKNNNLLEVINPREGNKTPLLYAASLGQKEVVQWLIREAKADSNKKDIDGNNALHLACSAGTTAVVSLLMDDKNLSTQLNEKGETPLDCAFKHKHIEIIKLFGQQLPKKKRSPVWSWRANF